MYLDGAHAKKLKRKGMSASDGNGDDRSQKYMSKEKCNLFNKCLPSCSCGFRRA